MRKNISFIIIILGLMISISACNGNGGGVENGDQTASPTATRKVSEEPREITRKEALELYGIGEDEEIQATRTPIQWFPISVWVNENVLPYDSNESVDELAVFTRWELSDKGTWLGDLQADTEVKLFNISEDRTACLIEGMTKQGWDVRGWVACNRLDFGRDE